jgi:hypothetical protein
MSAIVWNGSVLAASANSNSSTHVAWRLNTQKFTPSAPAVAPGGKREPGRVA